MSHFVVGLTGGVASGKSALADRFAALGVTIAKPGSGPDHWMSR